MHFENLRQITFSIYMWRICRYREAVLRTGAWHPLSNLNGSPGTRGTRSNDAPEILHKPMQIMNSSF